MALLESTFLNVKIKLNNCFRFSQVEPCLVDIKGTTKSVYGLYLQLILCKYELIYTIHHKNTPDI